MRFIIKSIILILGSYLLFLAHNAALLFLPSPLAYFNVLLAALIWLSLARDLSEVMIVAALAGFFSELYAATPFGIVLTSLIISLLFLHWLLRNVFTNHSWPTIFFCALICLTAYRLLFIGLLLATNLFIPALFAPNASLIKDFGLEIIVSSLGLTLLYCLVGFFNARLKSATMSRQFYDR